MPVGGVAKNISVLLTANNSNLKAVLASSARDVNAFTKDVERAGKSGGAALKSGLAVGALAAGAGIAYAVTKAIEFDKAMRNVNSLAGLGDAAFAALEKRVISMSTRLPQSATTLAEGLYDIQSSGFSGADAMKVLEASALSASAGLTTTEVAARAIAATLNAYGLQAKDAADVSDVLFQTVNAGVISFDELAGNLGDVVGGAAAAKVGIDQVGTAIATMTLAGIGGAESTTSLNALITKIVQPSKALAAQFKELGYESGASALESDGLRGVMDKLRVATGGNITTMLQLFPEIRAARGALALMANEGQNYTRVAGQIEDKTARAGAAQRVFHEQMKAAANQLTVLKNQVDAAAIGLGMSLLPALLKVMSGLQDLGKAGGDALGMLRDAFGPGLADLANILQDLWSMLVTVGGAVYDLAKPFVELGIGAIAETFNALLSVIEPITGALSENEAAVLALATALTVYLLGGVAAVSSAIGANLVLALARLLAGLESLPAAFAAARAGAGAMLATLGPLAALAAAVYVGVSAWNSYQAAVSEAEDALDSAAEAQKRGTATALAAEIESLDKLVAKRKELADEYGGRDIGTILKNLNPGRFDDQAALGQVDKYKEKTEELGSASQETKDALESLSNGVIVLAKGLGTIDPAKAKELRDALRADPQDIDALSKIDQLLGEMEPQFEAAGISARDLRSAIGAVELGKDGKLDPESLVRVRAEMKLLGMATDDTAAQQQDLADAFLATNNQAISAADAAKALKSALDDLLGSAIGADEAGIKYRDTLRSMADTIKENGNQLRGTSEGADKNRLAVQDQVSALEGLLVAQARNGAGADKLTRSLVNSRNEMVENAGAAGLNKKEYGALLRQYGLTPKLIKTIIEQSGISNAKADLKALGKEQNAIDKKHPKVSVDFDPRNKGALKQLADSVDAVGKKKANVKTDADDKGQKRLEKLGKLADETNGKSVAVPTSAPGATQAEQQLRNTKEAADRLDGTSATVTTYHRDVKKNADGSYFPGVSGTLPGQATIKAGSGAGLVQWAEGETGGEAFIPLGASKRARSTDILAQVAAQFGYGLESYMIGGTRGTHWGWADKGTKSPAGAGSSSGGSGGGGGASVGSGAPTPPTPGAGFTYHDFHFRKQKKNEKDREYAKAKADARKEYENDKKQAREDFVDAQWRAYQDAADNYRLSIVAAGGGSGAYTAGRDVGGNLQGIMDAREARAQAAAQLAANASANPNDSAEDFYTKPTLGIQDYVKALNDAATQTTAWGDTLRKVADGAGADVVASLKAMGEDGEAYIKLLATSSVADMQEMAAQLRRIQFMEFSQGIEQDVAAQSQFAGNLAALIRMGRGDLAAQFADMGYASAGGLAAYAVTATGSDLDTLTTNLAAQDTNNAPGFGAALALIGLLQSSARPLGIVGLSGASGKSISDVVGLLQTYAALFANLPGDRLSQINADQALLAAGQQPSGLVHGGIVSAPASSSGLFYQWAEPGSGGESLIPLGQADRSRALDLWQTTGRMIGANVRGGSSGGGSVAVMPGAVSVSIDASGQAMTPAELSSIASRAADQAMGKLADVLKGGRR